MHVLFVERHGLEETEIPVDLDHRSADLVILSFSDSDLSTFAAGWHRAKKLNNEVFPSVRIANLSLLKHPISVDTYIEKTLCHAKGILVRLIGGVPYWSYGLSQVAQIAKKNNIAFAAISADGRTDLQLDEISTVPISTLRRLQYYCEMGGEIAAHSALAQLALAAGLYVSPVSGSKMIGNVGGWTPEYNICCPFIARGYETKPVILITFYRSYITSADLKPIAALFHKLRNYGFAVMSLFVPSLKAPEAAAWLEKQILYFSPSLIVNATSFSGKGKDGNSPLDKANVPVFQIALSTSNRTAWAEAARGLSPADMAMHVVLPEVDGRIFAGVASFKEPEEMDEALQFAPVGHQPDEERINAICAKIVKWYTLQKTPIPKQKLTLILSTYPGRPWQMAHAVGLDAIASAQAILEDLGYNIETKEESFERLLTHKTMSWDIASYKTALSEVPLSLQEELYSVWGAPEADLLAVDGSFKFTSLSFGNALVALQPERGIKQNREGEYHDISRTPCHSYVAFYLWLQKVMKVDAIIHVGAHGTLEWLPGKAVALSDNCWPEVLAGNMPIIYPFIINDPGEAAQAKRRISAVTLGHIPPPLKKANTPEQFSQLESLLDEFSIADGLDPKRRDRLKNDIICEAESLGIAKDLEVDFNKNPTDILTRIDAFVCDIKESQFADGLHIFGRGGQRQTVFDTTLSVSNERQSIIDALSGKMIAAGPSGSPYRGRQDVLPSGRNLFSTDPLSVPTKAAFKQGIKLAEEFLRRSLQDTGEWPSGVIVDLWGSATMRTAGEEFAMALHLIGVKPNWSEGSDRVIGFEILPLAILDRPRIDTTLRVSGLFRDVFPTLSSLFQQAIDALCKRDERKDFNPYVGSKEEDSARIFSSAPNSYGLGMGDAAEQFNAAGRNKAANAWINASQFAVNGSKVIQNKQALISRIQKADSFIHMQDLRETDILISSDYAAHEGGFAAAKAELGGKVNLYHLDNTNPENPITRSLSEEIARVVYARASNPKWIDSMMRHRHRGAAEIAATLLHMAAFANLANAVGSHLFDSFHDATLGNQEIVCFMQEANPEALKAMQDCFEKLYKSGLWQTRRNSIHANLETVK